MIKAKKYFPFTFFLAYCFLPTAYCLLTTAYCQAQQDYTKYVDPMIGTGGHGHTYPGATLPFGMVQLSPDTREDGSWDGCSGYHYSDSLIFGFSHTHLSGTGCSDYGDILLAPVAGDVDLKKKYSAQFHHANEKAEAGFYSVKFDNGIEADLTATTRVGLHKYIFPYGAKPGVSLDLVHRDKDIVDAMWVVSPTAVEGMRRSEAWAKSQTVYFHIEFSKPFTIESYRADSAYVDEENHMTGCTGKSKVLFTFSLQPGEPLEVKVGISGVSQQGAKANMNAELPGWDFEKTKAAAKAAWNKELSKIEVSGTVDKFVSSDETTKTRFYTALYHCFLQPNIYNDVDGKYRGRDHNVHDAVGFNYYTVFSLWDTFRAWHPLMTIIDRKRTLDFIKTFLAQYEQGGMLPVWELSSNETECMIGYHAVSVIADAAAKGITDFNMEEALEAMKHSAEARDRYGLGAYMDNGFLSMEDENESVSKTLEYSYDDWCILQMADLLNKEKEFPAYEERSQSWKNLFDPETGFIRPRKNGGWMQPFDAREVNNNYTEANAWQYTFFVPYEIGSLINMMGGNDKFEKKLDELFSTESKTTGREQSDITGMIGQYAHGNEPSHHMAYLYNYIGKPWKTTAQVFKPLNDFYLTFPDGLIGNEDCGQMSAWYVMSAMGLYDVCPGDNMFDMVPSIFSHVTIHLENGKDFEMEQRGKWNYDSYIAGFTQKNDSFATNMISSNMILSGGKFIRQLEVAGGSLAGVITNKPYRTWISTTPITRVPLINGIFSFKNSQNITISAFNSNDKIYYTTDGSVPTTKSTEYKSAIPINSSSTIKAIAVNDYGVDMGKQSKVVTAHFNKNPHPNWKIKIVSSYAHQYTAGGDEALIDGIRGSVNWRKGDWQGYEGKDMEIVIDLGEERKVGSFSATFLQDIGAWIFLPKKVEFSFSKDGITFSDLTSLRNSVSDRDEKVQIKNFQTSLFRPVEARYVKVKAERYGKLPSWHLGAGGDSWIFADEIFIN